MSANFISFRFVVFRFASLYFVSFRFVFVSQFSSNLYFCIETKINVFYSSVNSFVPKKSKFMVIFTGMFEMDNINSCLMSANLEQ